MNFPGEDSREKFLRWQGGRKQGYPPQGGQGEQVGRWRRSKISVGLTMVYQVGR